MIVGVTGSRSPRPELVISRLEILLSEWGATELHHGDCVGFDQQSFDVAKRLGIKTICHPPKCNTLRAFTLSDETLEPLPYLDRNRAIVAAVDALIAAPDKPEHIRSGTWSTIRHAKKQGVRGVILPINLSA